MRFFVRGRLHSLALATPIVSLCVRATSLLVLPVWHCLCLRQVKKKDKKKKKKDKKGIERVSIGSLSSWRRSRAHPHTPSARLTAHARTAHYEPAQAGVHRPYAVPDLSSDQLPPITRPYICACSWGTWNHKGPQKWSRRRGCRCRLSVDGQERRHI